MAIKIIGTTVIDDSRNITNINTAATGNVTVTGFVNATSTVNSSSFNVGTTQFANTTGVYATFMNSKTEGNLNVNAAAQLTTARTIGDVSFNGTTNIVPSRINYKDTRSTDHAPYTYPGVSMHLKTNTTDGLADGGTLHGVLDLAQWVDTSGGSQHQLGLTVNGKIWSRYSTNSTTWSSWSQLVSTTSGTALNANNSSYLGSIATANTTALYHEGLSVNSTVITSNATGGLTIRETGDEFGTVSLQLRNVTGLNGARFIQGNTSLNLIDFMFSPNTSVDRLIRMEGRAGFVFNSNSEPEFQFGIATNPALTISDNFVVVRDRLVSSNDATITGNVGIGNTSLTDKLSVNGTTYFGGNVQLGTSSISVGLRANGSYGTAGQVLTSNGTATYWATAAAAGVTSVASGNGITGGPITSTGTLSAVAGTGTVVNSTGIHVNATYIGTLSANNTTYVNGKTEGNLNVNNATTAYGKTEGNLNVNNATTATRLTTADIPNAADLNNYTTTGIYHQGLNAQAATGSNYPIAEAGLLEVYTGGSMVYQRYTHYASGRIYTRSKYLTTWYSWLVELDSGNYSSYALPLSGGAMTGSVQFTINSGNGINLNGTDTTMHRIYTDGFYTIFKSHVNEGWKFRDNNNVDRLTILGANGNMATSGSVSGGLFGIAADGNNRFIQGGLILRSGSPTIYFRDTDNNSAMLHNNSNLLYVLRGGNDTESWTAIGGEWPWYWNLTDNSSRCGGALNVVSDITAFVSDRRLKTDIETLKNSLSKVKQITGIRYRHNEFAKSKNLPEGPHVGVIAQELEKVLPEAIAPAPFDTDEHGKSKSGENYKTVKYDKIVPLLIEAIKELSGQVDDLKKELAEFKKK